MFPKIEHTHTHTSDCGRGFHISKEHDVRNRNVQTDVAGHMNIILPLAFTGETSKSAWKTQMGFSPWEGTRLQKPSGSPEKNKKELALWRQKCVSVVFSVKPHPFPQRFEEQCVFLKIVPCAFSRFLWAMQCSVIFGDPLICLQRRNVY